jgi:ABC-2 type transport system ATP-binding protein
MAVRLHEDMATSPPPTRLAMSLRIERITKTYPNGVRALNDISLSIAPGMFGLLGPNGAGKSSLMRTIATLQQPDSGSIHFRDIDVLREPEKLRAQLGYLPQEFGLYPNMPADAILDHFATLKGVVNPGERKDLVGALLQQVNLYDVRKKSVGGYSGGMKQRLGIAIALAGSPKLLIVDEPTAGLDPTERNRFLNLLADIGEDVVVILSTHIVEDVRELCSQMAIINKGQVVVQGEPERIIDEVRGRIWRRTIPRVQADEYKQRYQVISTRMAAGNTVLHVYAESDPGDGFVQVEPDLEDVYFHRLAEVSGGRVPVEA